MRTIDIKPAGAYSYSTLDLGTFSSEIQQGIAKECVNPDILDVLSESTDFSIKLIVYENPNTRPDTKKAMLKNPAFQMHLLRNAQQLSEKEIRELAVYEDSTSEFLALLPSLSSTPNQIEELISENLTKQKSKIITTILEAKPETRFYPNAPLEGAELCMSLLASPAADKEVVELTIAKLWSMNFRLYFNHLLSDVLKNPKTTTTHLEICLASGLASCHTNFEPDLVEECLSDERFTKASLVRLIHLGQPYSELNRIIEHRTTPILSNRFGNEYKDYIISLITNRSKLYDPKIRHIWPIQCLIETTNSKTVLEFVVENALDIADSLTSANDWENEDIVKEFIVEKVAERKRELS